MLVVFRSSLHLLFGGVKTEFINVHVKNETEGELLLAKLVVVTTNFIGALVY